MSDRRIITRYKLSLPMIIFTVVLITVLAWKMDLGMGSGPVDHSWNLHGDFFEN